MRFFWFHPVSHGTAATPSVVLSVVAHAALFGAVVYGTGRHADPLDTDAGHQLFYLPPPDRLPGHAATEEHLQYVEVGAGRTGQPVDAPAAPRAGTAAPTGDRAPGGVSGEAAKEQAPAAAVDSPDSVYSVLSLEETALRVESSAAPVYPAEMVARGIEGAVRTRYVIDTTGRADSASFEVLSATNEAFVLAVRAAIPGMRFVPANVMGRTARQLVEQEFQFRLGIPTPAGAPAEHTRTAPVP